MVLNSPEKQEKQMHIPMGYRLRIRSTRKIWREFSVPVDGIQNPGKNDAGPGAGENKTNRLLSAQK